MSDWNHVFQTSLRQGWSTWTAEEKLRLSQNLDAVPRPFSLQTLSQRAVHEYKSSGATLLPKDIEKCWAEWMKNPDKYGFQMGLWLRHAHRLSYPISKATGWNLMQILPLYPSYRVLVQRLLGEKFHWYASAMKPFTGWETWHPGAWKRMTYHSYLKGWEKAQLSRPEYLTNWLLSHPPLAPNLLLYTEGTETDVSTRKKLLTQLLEKADGALWLMALQSLMRLHDGMNEQALRRILPTPSWTLNYPPSLWQATLSGEAEAYSVLEENKVQLHPTRKQNFGMFGLAFALWHGTENFPCPEAFFPDFQEGHAGLDLSPGLLKVWSKARPISFFKHHRFPVSPEIFSLNEKEFEHLRIPESPPKAVLEGLLWHMPYPFTPEVFAYLWAQGTSWPKATRAHWHAKLKAKAEIDQLFFHA